MPKHVILNNAVLLAAMLVGFSPINTQLLFQVNALAEESQRIFITIDLPAPLFAAAVSIAAAPFRVTFCNASSLKSTSMLAVVP